MGKTKALSEEQEKTRMELYEAGFTDRQIAKRIGLTPSGAGQWRTSRGLPPNKKSGAKNGHGAGIEAASNMRGISEIAAKARELGLSYGQYMAHVRDGRL